MAVIDSEFDTSNPDLGPKLIQRYNVASGTAQYHTGNVDGRPATSSMAAIRAALSAP